MKFFAFLVLLALAFSYDGNAAVNYALRYCKNYNPSYNKYPGVDCANFVSQCLKAGGFSFSGCSGKDSKGMLPAVSDLKSCLSKNGWSKSSTRPGAFKKGYPFFMNAYSHAMLATKINSGSVNYAGHTNDRCGDVTISSGVTYYYL